jgi:hypothetical protein
MTEAFVANLKKIKKHEDLDGGIWRVLHYTQMELLLYDSVREPSAGLSTNKNCNNNCKQISFLQSVMSSDESSASFELKI